MIINNNGHLVLGGVDSLQLAKQYGTPLYVMDEGIVRKSCRVFKSSMDEFYNGNGLVVYASKSFMCKEICRIIMDEGLGIDVVSGGELYTALSVGFPCDKIYFHGNNKTFEELSYAIENNVGCIIVDNLTELSMVNYISASQGKISKIMLRIKPGIDAHTHDFIRTGQIDSKFGFALETGEAMKAVMIAIDMCSVEIIGLHCHVGSQIFDTEPFVAAAEVMCCFMADIKQASGTELSVLNLGGGFGIRYTQNDYPVPCRDYMKLVSNQVEKVCKERNYKMPFIIIEPGRSISGPAGTTIYKVGSVKKIEGIRTYVAVDGGITDNPRYALYGAEYEIVNIENAAEPKDMTITLAGRCCESGDLLGENLKVQQVKVGSYVASMATGAYNYSMSSNYNRLPRPAVVMVNDGTSRVIVKRETYADIIKNDL